MYRSNRSFNMPPPGIPRAFDTFAVPGRREFDYHSLPGGRECVWSPCFRGGGFELHPQFHVKSLAWRAIMGDVVLEDFRRKDCAFVASWLRGKGLKWSWCSNLNRWDLVFFEGFVCCVTKKSWAFSDLVAAISLLCMRLFVRSKYANSVSQFLLCL